MSNSQLKRIGSSKVEFTVAQAASDDVDDSENDASTVTRPISRHKRRTKTAVSPLLLNTPSVLPAAVDGDDYSESSNDDATNEIQCNCSVHEGKEMLNEIFPISVDQMFLLLFTDSVFFRQLQEFRKTTSKFCSWKLFFCIFFKTKFCT